MSTFSFSAAISHLKRGITFFRDREYYAQLFNIALPIALQQLIISSLNMMFVMLLGQLGEVPVAAVGLANQVFFLLQLFLFGINSGAAIFTAQLWGKGDIANIRRVVGLALGLSLAVGIIFSIVALLMPAQVLSLYSEDPQVIREGAHFLRIFGWSYLFFSVTSVFAMLLRSIGDVRMTLAVSVGALSLSTLLSYVFIFGIFGIPAMGVPGAALGGLIARILETILLVSLSYLRKSPIAIHPRDLQGLDLAFARKVLTPVLPVAANEIFWSLGITTYNAIYARMSTASIAAINITSSIDALAIVVLLGIGNACAILVGNRIGAGKLDEAQVYAGRSLALSMFAAVIVGAGVWFSSSAILSLYKVSPEVIAYARGVLGVMSLLLWLRAGNIVLFIGILRSGGDTRFGLLLDGGIIWMLGVPMAMLGAFVFHFPIYYVYLMVYSEEFTKWVLAMWRFFSKKWIHDLASTV